MRIDLTLDHALLFVSTGNEWRELVRRAESKRAEARQLDLDSQLSPAALPDERIRIWEELHALSLPRTPDHPLLGVIAKQTHLSVSDVKDEQDRRRSRLDSAVGGGQ